MVTDGRNHTRTSTTHEHQTRPFFLRRNMAMRRNRPSSFAPTKHCVQGNCPQWILCYMIIQLTDVAIIIEKKVVSTCLSRQDVLKRKWRFSAVESASFTMADHRYDLSHHISYPAAGSQSSNLVIVTPVGAHAATMISTTTTSGQSNVT